MLTFSRTLLSSIIFSCFLIAEPAMANTSDELKALKQEIQSLQEGQEKIQKDLAEIRKMLEKPTRAAAGKTAFEPTDIELGEVPYKGEYDAPVTLIEFSDYQCPFCKRHANSVMPSLIASYVDTGKVRFVMREYPIPHYSTPSSARWSAAACSGSIAAAWVKRSMASSRRPSPSSTTPRL